METTLGYLAAAVILATVILSLHYVPVIMERIGRMVRETARVDFMRQRGGLIPQTYAILDTTARANVQEVCIDGVWTNIADQYGAESAGYWHDCCGMPMWVEYAANDSLETGSLELFTKRGNRYVPVTLSAADVVASQLYTRAMRGKRPVYTPFTLESCPINSMAA